APAKAPSERAKLRVRCGRQSDQAPGEHLARASPLSLAGGENLGAVVQDGDRVLEMSRQRAVGSHHGPAIVEGNRLPAADVDHGLDRDNEARLELRSPPGLAVVGNLRVFVKGPANPVAHVLADDGESGSLRNLLNGMTYVRNPAPRRDLGDSR